MSKVKGFNPKWLYRLTALLWVIAALSFALATYSSNQSTWLSLVSILVTILFPLTVVSAVIYTVNYRSQNRVEAADNLGTRIIAFLIPIALVVSTVTAIKSLWLPISYAKYAYENTSVIALLLAVFLIMWLNTMQKAIFWFRRDKKQILDERQLRQRQLVLEQSYKISGVVILVAGLFAHTYVDHLSIFAKLDNPWGNIPGHALIPIYCLLILLLTMPVLVAANQKKIKD